MNFVGKVKRFQWKSRKSLTLVAILLLAIIFLRIKYYRYSTEIKLAKAKAETVWEYVADFSNLKQLNPSIVDFLILNDSGNFETWHYTVQYKEVSSNWPYLTSATLAHFEVKHVNKLVQAYYINSNHTSCMAFGCICLTTYSSYDFTQQGNGVDVFELVNYQCPVIFSGLCRKNIEHQRELIARNLIKHFS